VQNYPWLKQQVKRAILQREVKMKEKIRYSSSFSKWGFEKFFVRHRSWWMGPFMSLGGGPGSAAARFCVVVTDAAVSL
jgi:hypothetical protein